MSSPQERIYVYDIKLSAVVTVSATTKRQALKLVSMAIDSLDFHLDPLMSGGESKVIEASVFADDVAGPTLLEVDGEEPDEV